MSYIMELNSGDKLEINFSLMNDLLMKHGYNTKDMYLINPNNNPYIQFTDSSETYPTTITVQTADYHNWRYKVYVNDTMVLDAAPRYDPHSYRIDGNFYDYLINSRHTSVYCKFFIYG